MTWKQVLCMTQVDYKLWMARQFIASAAQTHRIIRARAVGSVYYEATKAIYLLDICVRKDCRPIPIPEIRRFLRGMSIE